MRYGAPEGSRSRQAAARLSTGFWTLTAAIRSPFVPMRRATFSAWGRSHRYFVHRYNMTWCNERSVEVPLAMDFLARHGRGRGLEVGNVLAHYRRRGDWQVVDKYERAANVERVDVLDVHPDEPLDFLVSISTLEHVGWDEEPRDPDKALRALEHLRAQLAAAGAMFVTIPLGHHPRLDEALQQGIGATRELTMLREPDGRWTEASILEVRPYIGRKGVGAASVWIGELGRW